MRCMRGFLGAPSMGTDMEVEVLPRAGHSKRSEPNRKASLREAGVKEAGSETAGRRTGTG